MMGPKPFERSCETLHLFRTIVILMVRAYLATPRPTIKISLEPSNRRMAGRTIIGGKDVN